MKPSKIIKNNEELKKMIHSHDISNFDISNVTILKNAFLDNLQFNEPLNDWNVLNVTDMESMFNGAMSFNQPLDRWIVSRVENMEGMFQEAESFNQPLNSWDVSNVRNMESMFDGAKSFNQPLNSWDVSNVRNMKSMFDGAKSFNQPLDNWNVSNVSNMERMFAYSDFSHYESLYNWSPPYGVIVEDIFSFSSVKFNPEQEYELYKQGYEVLRRWLFKEMQNPTYNYETNLTRNVRRYLGTLSIDDDYFDNIFEDLMEIIPDANTNFDEYNQEAVEIHKGFNKININKYKELIGFNDQEPPIDNITDYIKNKFIDYINTAQEETTDNTVSTSSRKRGITTKSIWNTTEKKNLKTKLNLIINKLNLCDIFVNPHNNLLAKQTIDFVFKQPSIFIADYINNYINNVSNAYNGSTPDSKLACVKGMFEQFIMSLVSPITIIQTSSVNDNPIFYKELLNSIIPPDEMTQGFLDEWLKEQTENVTWAKLTSKKRTESLINYIKQRYASNNIIKDNNEINNALQSIEHWNSYYLPIINAPGPIQLGGKRKSRKLRRKMRKRKSRKLSRKMRKRKSRKLRGK